MVVLVVLAVLLALVGIVFAVQLAHIREAARQPAQVISPSGAQVGIVILPPNASINQSEGIHGAS